jgi:sec-independent protein translocase protein TatC
MSRPPRAPDGRMSLVDHLRELRSRLLKSVLAIVAAGAVSFAFFNPIWDVLKRPYCQVHQKQSLALIHSVKGCGAGPLVFDNVFDPILWHFKVALIGGLVLASPVWLYQLWAFIAPGLHRHERKWAYVFVAIAAPLFASGAVLAYLVVGHSLSFIMKAGVLGEPTKLEVTAYTGFVTSMILLFGAAFEFPLILLMLNFTGVTSAKRLLSWWRVVVFLSFAFAAIATPDPGPFGMTLLAACMSLLYFIAVGVAFLNDKRKGRGKEMYAGLDDDEMSTIEDDREAVTGGQRIDGPTAVDSPQPVNKPLPLESRFDDMT